MKFLKSWLQDYIVEPLPTDEEIRDVLNKKAFEVEEVLALKKDTIFDIKVLPNRAHDALGHRGMAKEICADLGLTFKEDERIILQQKMVDPKIQVVDVEIENPNACTRFMSMRIEGIKVAPGPKWLKERLEAIGQRSINNIVDITNYVQFSLNKPMHAYDARKVTGKLSVRFAQTGEKLETLDDKELKLNKNVLVIADDEKVLALAGIKGGKPSGIDEGTTTVIIESANFNPSLIRRTSAKYDLRTDASKRFENGIANSLVEEGLYMTANLIKQVCKSAKRSSVVDVYPKKDKFFKVGMSFHEINSILGTSYSDDEMHSALQRVGFSLETIAYPREKIVSLAEECLGKPYIRGASVLHDAPEAFDCSSFTSWVYKESGYQIPRILIDQYVFTEPIEGEPNIGDLVFTNTKIEKTKGGSHYSQVLQKEIPEAAIRTETVEFLRGTKVEQGMDHNGVYVGGGYVVHATSVFGKVIKEKLSESKVFGNGYEFRKVIHKEELRTVVTVPSERLDIRIKEDLAEEIGRIIGYDTIQPTLPTINKVGSINKRTHYENKIREILFSSGFSEVITYTFGNTGEVEIMKGLAKDKEKLRSELGNGLLGSLHMNLHNAPLLGQKTIKIFEIGNVFTKENEKRQLSIAIDDGGKKSNFSEEVDLILAGIKRTLGIKTLSCETVSAKPYVLEIDIDDLIINLEEPVQYEKPLFANLPDVGYQSISPYPFIARDIAMWVPDSISWESIRALCSEISNPLVTRVDLFDTFTKEVEGVKKTSYAFRLVFQAPDRTLTDEEVNKMMEPYYGTFKEKGYEIR
jgi:phenylalanyl-tRNA synthetase beta subunit